MAAPLAASDATGCRSDSNCASHPSSTNGIAMTHVETAPLDRQSADERGERQQRPERGGDGGRARPVARDERGDDGPAHQAPQHDRRRPRWRRGRRAGRRGRRRPTNPPSDGHSGERDRPPREWAPGCEPGPSRIPLSAAITPAAVQVVEAVAVHHPGDRRRAGQDVGECDDRRPRSRRRADPAPRWRSRGGRDADGRVRRHTISPPTARRASTTITPSCGSMPSRAVTDQGEQNSQQLDEKHRGDTEPMIEPVRGVERPRHRPGDEGDDHHHRDEGHRGESMGALPLRLTGAASSFAAA